MKVVDVDDAAGALPQLLVEVENGEEVAIARGGRLVARLVQCHPASAAVREAGILRAYPAWKDCVYDPGLFGPMTDEEMQDEGWP